MKKSIAVLPGDGIGPEVMAQALRLLGQVAQFFGHQFEFTHALAGGAAYEQYGQHLPKETIEICRKSDAILFGSVGGPVSEMDAPKWKNCEANSILTLRKTFGFHANFRPVRVFPQLASMSPLRADIVERGIDLLVVRELLGDCYFGVHETYDANGQRAARDVSTYTEEQVTKVSKAAFEAARKRRKKVTSVDKANVLETSRLWRKVVTETAAHYSDVELEHMLVDNCAMQIVLNPSQFDVVLTTNMFGDILSDAAAVLPGSLGMLASASINDEGFGLYEPPGGSAQDIAGTGNANPIAQILSSALMLRFAFNMNTEATCLESAVEGALDDGFRTRDIAGGAQQSKNIRIVGTEEMASAISERFAAVAKAVAPIGCTN
jgi:3-isopropylmalate dehydrogenase